MRRQHGTIEAIERLVQSGDIQSGFKRLQNPAARNGIFGCGDTPPKIATKMGERSQRQKSGK
jgi:hypothetical protein